MDELISKKKALECFNFTNTRAGAKHAIETLPDETPSLGKWIQASAKLPEEKGNYWITIEFEHKEGYEDFQTAVTYYEDGKWYDVDRSFIGEPKAIVAWMPYREPEPWKGDTNGRT